MAKTESPPYKNAFPGGFTTKIAITKTERSSLQNFQEKSQEKKQ
jgi:hypothetical protein